MYVAPTFAERFWSKVAKAGPDDCWLWTGATTGRAPCNTYGMIWGGNGRPRRVAAHRASYELCHGPIPAGMLIMHRCDTPLCVNPAHLKLGTDAENFADMREKNRQVRGEKHPKARLTENDVRWIREQYAIPGVTMEQLGNRFGIDTGHIAQIVHGKIWQHVK